jgi:amino acid adenylation domain-containing protein
MFAAIHQLCQGTAERCAERIAIDTSGRRLTYGELLGRANGIAAALLAGGVEKSSLVGLLAGATEDLVAGMLGVLQAGCAFVPLDRRSPAVRLESIVDEVRPGHWLVSPDLAGLAGDLRRRAGGAGETILLGDRTPRRDRAPEVPEPDPESLCYVFFTSGSTGRPKGIAGRLKAIDHYIRWEIETFAVGESCRVSQLTSPAFDAVLRDVFVPLVAGGTLCAPADREAVLDGARLVEWIDGERLTLVHCTPTVFRSWLRQDLTADRFPALRHVLLAGEPLPSADVRRWRAVFGDRIELVNLYGPSETTMTKLFHRVRPADAEARIIPAGQPMPGARVIVLDQAGSPCPPGQVGEIVLRTPYRSLGYLNQPELTATVFVRNRWSDRPDDLVYRTGDVGRLREDGQLEFLGRRDRQVKVRGVRVELGPIEEALRACPGVRDAAVVDRADGEGDKFLCAYLVLDGCGGEAADAVSMDAGRLREQLVARLPEAMVPSAFMRLDILPRTVTGKLDRRALPDPRSLAGRASPGQVAARTPLEAKLAAGRRAQGEIPPQPEADSYPLSFAQQRLWLVDQVEAASPFYNVAAAVRLRGPLRVDLLRSAAGGILRRHESLRTVFRVEGGEPRQVIQPPRAAELPLIDLSAAPAPAAIAERLAREGAHAAFDLARGPLCRGRLLRLADQDHVLLWVVHHVVADWWSLEVLVRELGVLYGALGRGEPAGLPEPAVRYRDFAVWQRGRLQGDVLAEARSFWRRRLAGAPPLLRLAADRPRPAWQSFRGGRLQARLPGELGRRVAALSQRQECTVFMTLLGAFAVALYHSSEQQDLVVGAPFGARRRSDIADLVGLFVNVLPLRLDLSGEPTFRELLARVRQEVLAAVRHEHMPFEKLVEELQPERARSHHPLFQVTFNMVEGDLAEPLAMPGLEVAPFPLAGELTQFDLSVTVLRQGHELTAAFHYSTDLFDELTIAWMGENLRQVLDEVTAVPDTPLPRLREVLAAAGRRRRAALAEQLRGAQRQSFGRRRRLPAAVLEGA